MAGILLLLVTILAFSVNGILSMRADRFLRDHLLAIDTNDYRVGFKNVRVNIFTRSLQLSGIEIQPTSGALGHVRLSRLAKPLIGLKVEKIKISSVAILSAIRGKSVKIGSIGINKPEITIYSPQAVFTDGEREKSGFFTSNTDSIVPALLRKSHLSRFEITDAAIHWVDMRKEKEVLRTNGLGIIITGISVDSTNNSQPLMALNIDNFRLWLESYSMDLPGKLYRLETGTLAMDYEESKMILDSLRLIPLYQKEELGKVLGRQTDWFNIQTAQIHIKGIAFDSLMNNKVMISSLDIHDAIAEIYRDKRIPRDMSIFPKLFQTAIAQIPAQLCIDTINVSGSQLGYAERIFDSEKSGKVRFSEIKLQVTGINNNHRRMRDGQSMLVNATGKLMNKTNFDIHFNLPLGREDEYFTFYGETGSFEMPIMNPLIEPLAFIEMRAGNVHSIKFYGLSQYDTAVGRVKFLYDDIDLVVVKKNLSSKGQIEENRFLSFIANSVMHKNNPSHNKPPRIGKMTFVRDPVKGFFNYTWKTLQDGLINTIAPVKKKHATDMDWPAFEKNWENILQQDLNEVNRKSRQRSRDK
ncbi:MAG: hypothetical protein RQ761_06985 [Bacteroidales bacterium]|nr:hypothetical protein [Bacteroidales bacterium]